MLSSLSKRLTGLFFIFFLLPLTSYAESSYAESSVKVFHTQQPAQSLIPTLAPLYDNQAKITARNNLLIVKAPEHIINEIEKLLNNLDKPLKNLLIEVRSTLDSNEDLRQDSVQGRIKMGNDSEIRSRAPYNNNPDTVIRYGKDGSVISTSHTRRSHSGSNPNTFRLRALEGSWAYIQVGQKVAYYNSDYPTPYYGNNRYYRPRQQSVQLEDVTSGFDVYPTLQGENVTLKVRPHNRSMNNKKPDRINTRSIDTVVTGKIGQWIYLGGAINQINEKNSGYTHSTKRYSQLDASYRVKVNIID